MLESESIKQNQFADLLPNFRNMGTIMRLVLMVNGIFMLACILLASSWSDSLRRFVENSALLQPATLTVLLLLYLMNRALRRLPYWKSVGLILLVVILVVQGLVLAGGYLFVPAVGSAAFQAGRNALLGSMLAAVLLLYFRMRALSLATALHDARLQALQARIRPHFLFNSINAVLSIVRAEPRRAETALEDMADLFRMAMADNNALVPLRREIELSRQYLALESLRLGERLAIEWDVEEVVQDALVPPMMLQPLLENAVYHGIEPLPEGGKISIRVNRSGPELHMEISNPCCKGNSAHNGNKMALTNIRERLALKFDVEAKYRVERGEDFYRVHIQMPLIQKAPNYGPGK